MTIMRFCVYHKTGANEKRRVSAVSQYAIC